MMLILAIAAQSLSPSVSLPADRWARCLSQHAEARARSSEPAEAVVRAAFGACLAEEEAARQDHAKTGTGSGEEFSRRLRGLWGNQLATIVARTRQNRR